MGWQHYTISNDQRYHLNSEMLPAYKHQFDNVLAFHAPGLAPVMFENNAWHIHPDGSPAYTQRFDRSFGFYGERAAVVIGNDWFHIFLNGNPAYNERYSWVGNFQGGYCSVRDKDGQYFYINKSGECLYHNSWKYCGDYRENIAVVQDDTGKSTHINNDGTYLHDIWFDDLDVFHKGYARAKFSDGWAHIDRKGQAIYLRRFTAIEPFYNGQSRVECSDGAYEVIDEQGNTVTILRPATRSEFSMLSGDMVGFWRSQTIATAVELGLIDQLPGTANDIAKQCHLDRVRVTRLLRALGELDIVNMDNGHWKLSSRGQYLHSSNPLTLADAAKEYGRYFPAMWSNLSLAIKNDGQWLPPDIFNDIAHDEQRRVPHHRMLQSYARHDYINVTKVLQLKGNEDIVDAGGGLGTLANYLLASYPELVVTVLDRPEVIEQAQDNSDISDINWVTGNLFETWEVSANTVILARVLHDWDDENAICILKRAREPLSSGDTLYIIEMLLTENSFDGSLCDLHLLMATGGQERTESEYIQLLNNSGFKLKEVRSINGLSTVLVSVAI
jgi:hypothetical protein